MSPLVLLYGAIHLLIITADQPINAVAVSGLVFNLEALPLPLAFRGDGVFILSLWIHIRQCAYQL